MSQQNECVQTLFVALNDEEFTVREVVLCILGRLAKKKSGLAMPQLRYLRKTLIQLLTELQFSQFSTIISKPLYQNKNSSQTCHHILCLNIT